MQSLQDELAALKVVDTKVKKQKSQVIVEADKKRKPVKESHGVAKLKRVNTDGMSKISNFFQKPK
jgi:ribonuclease H2 subunit B